MKDLIKTTILVSSILLISLITIFIIGHIEQGVKMLSRNNLALNDPTVIILQDRILNNNELRQAHLIPNDVANDELIKYALVKIDANAYTFKTIKPSKIVCTVKEGIEFISDEECNIRIISNQKIIDFLNQQFNITKSIIFNNLNYQNLSCQNDGTNYYCLETAYDNSIIGYSLLKDAYETKDKTVIHEYYLRIDLKDNKRCLNYFNQDYCQNGQVDQRLPLDDEIIKKDGVLYEHVFAKKDNAFYLVESHITNER